MSRVQASSGPETIEFKSGDKVLHGLLYKPPGKGPFPAVLYNHGGSPGLVNNAAFVAIAPHFIERGWVFFAPYRREQGLSENAGTFIGAQIDAADQESGAAAVDQTVVGLLAGEQLAGAHWLEAQPFVPQSSSKSTTRVMWEAFNLRPPDDGC